MGGPLRPPTQMHALVIILSSSQSSTDLHVELGLDSLLEEVQILTAAEDSEIVTKDGKTEVP